MYIPITAICLYCGRGGAGLSVVWELYRKPCKVASRWKYIKTNILTMHGPLNVKIMVYVTVVYFEQY